MKKLILLIIVCIATFFMTISEGKAEMKIRITTGKYVILASLNDSAPAQDFAAKLPITLKMNAHQNREHYANIQLKKSERTKDSYKIGDLAYWTPGDTFVLFHGEGHTGSLIIMGEITSGLDLLQNMDGDFTAIFEKVDEHPGIKNEP